jgi:hypothetical protein
MVASCVLCRAVPQARAFAFKQLGEKPPPSGSSGGQAGGSCGGGGGGGAGAGEHASIWHNIITFIFG